MLQNLIDTYGYLAILIGTFLEGETILILGGFAAQRGYLDLTWTIAVAFLGTFCGDQFFFFLGRTRGRKILSRRPGWQQRVKRAERLWVRFQTPLMLGFRFLYGLRSVIPFMIGMSDVPTRKFFFLNLAGAVIWSVTVGVLGYLFGTAVERVFGDLKRYEVGVLGLMVAAGALVWLVHLVRQRKSDRRERRPARTPDGKDRFGGAGVGGEGRES